MAGSSNRTLAILLVIGVVIVLFLLFRLYIVSQSMNDVIVILIEQTWSLREWCIMNTYNRTGSNIQWPNDALLVHGRKGELLIRRFALQQQWATRYKGENNDNLRSIRDLIDDIDTKLLDYRLNLSVITSLTEKMMEEIYHNDMKQSISVTKTILRHIRML